MPHIQEMRLQAPDLTRDCFFVEKRGKEYQRWDSQFIDGDQMEFFYEDEQAWLIGTVASSYISDGSGNAPEANANYFLVIERGGKKYRYDLHEDLLIRMEVPTDAELIARSGWCEGGDWEDRGPYMPENFIHCNQRGKHSISPGGWHCWYCEMAL